MRLILSLAALFLSIILLQLASGGVGPLDALTGLEEGFSKGQIGVLGSSHFFGMLVGSTRHGNRRPFTGIRSFFIHGRNWNAGPYFIS